MSLIRNTKLLFSNQYSFSYLVPFKATLSFYIPLITSDPPSEETPTIDVPSATADQPAPSETLDQPTNERQPTNPTTFDEKPTTQEPPNPTEATATVPSTSPTTPIFEDVTSTFLETSVVNGKPRTFTSVFTTRVPRSNPGAYVTDYDSGVYSCLEVGHTALLVLLGSSAAFGFVV
ncbi:hypothetical protein L0F63_002052 [Massospora cicadina]|nr:hypothetical protein L0F63_002052 [Massospora cicadina]